MMCGFTILCKNCSNAVVVTADNARKILTGMAWGTKEPKVEDLLVISREDSNMSIECKCGNKVVEY
jgi:hypothetical protein